MCAGVGVIVVVAQAANRAQCTSSSRRGREAHKYVLETRYRRLWLIVIAVVPPFQTPVPKALEGYKLELTDPKLYRPFRHGPSFVTMGIRKMDWNAWIEMDSNFLSYHDTKVSELEKDVDARVQYVDNEVTRLACFEVLEELTQYLTQRYPEVFQLHSGLIHNTVTGEQFQYPAATPKEAMVTAAKLVQDDLVIMVENDDGQYHIDAGAVCLPGFWRLRTTHRSRSAALSRKAPKGYESLFQINDVRKACHPQQRKSINPYYMSAKTRLIVTCSISFNLTTASPGRTGWATKTHYP
jgi:uncharacterized protein YbdZ (MbtH family)